MLSIFPAPSQLWGRRLSMVRSEVFFKAPCVKSWVVSLRCYWDGWTLKKAGPSRKQITELPLE